MSERIVVKKDGVVVFGPGPTPYFWKDPKTGKRHELTNIQDPAITVETVVQSYGANPQHADDGIILFEAPTFTDVDGVPTETYPVRFNPQAEDIMIAKVEAYHNAKVASDYSSDELRYLTEEANDLNAKILASELWLANDYPFLEAEIGATPEIIDVETAANVILAYDASFKTTVLASRTARLADVASIKAATTNEKKLAIYEAALGL